MRFRIPSVTFPRRTAASLRAHRETARATMRLLAAGLLLCVLSLVAPGAFARPDITPGASRISIVVDGKPALTLDRAALAALPRVTVVASSPHDPSSRWQGVALDELLHRAGVPTGGQLRGHAMGYIVRVSASDHYQVVFSLAELDPRFGNEQVILVDTRDGQPLGKDGPFRLIVPGDKRPARWIHNITAIDVINESPRLP